MTSIMRGGYPPGVTDADFDDSLDDSFTGCDPECEAEGEPEGTPCGCWDRHEQAYLDEIENSMDSYAEDREIDERECERDDGGWW